MIGSLPPDLHRLQSQIHACHQCARLREHCQWVAQEKRKSFRNETYWGRPVAGFGDPKAKLYILGLAPAAHGANRTGRIFTGDRSGDWLYHALHRYGFANQATSVSKDDGLILKHAWVSCAVRCAPPENKPTREEFEACRPFLQKELQVFSEQTRVFIVLGGLALKALWCEIGAKASKPPKFKHGAEIKLNSQQTLLISYHPSQQNTFTGRLTEPMFHSVFARAKTLLDSPQ
jgi:uracil-DNA glycosylase family 4